MVDVRSLHPLEELSDVGRHRLDESSLALGVERIEGERRLSGTGRTGHDRESTVWDLDGKIAQIVRPRILDRYRAPQSWSFESSHMM